MQITLNMTVAQDIRIITPVEIPSEIVHQHRNYRKKHPTVITHNTIIHSDQAIF